MSGEASFFVEPDYVVVERRRRGALGDLELELRVYDYAEDEHFGRLAHIVLLGLGDKAGRAAPLSPTAYEARRVPLEAFFDFSTTVCS